MFAGGMGAGERLFGRDVLSWALGSGWRGVICLKAVLHVTLLLRSVDGDVEVLYSAPLLWQSGGSSAGCDTSHGTAGADWYVDDVLLAAAECEPPHCPVTGYFPGTACGCGGWAWWMWHTALCCTQPPGSTGYTGRGKCSATCCPLMPAATCCMLLQGLLCASGGTQQDTGQPLIVV